MATYEHILKNGNKVQVDSAIRDGDGVNIATKYAKKSELVNFITKTVNDLVNYYKKTETYTKEEVNNKISEIPKFAIKVVAMLPTSNISATTVYLVTSQSSTTQNLYDEYIYVDGKWEKLGSQTIDLSGYLKTHYEDDNQNTSNLIATATDIGIYASGDGYDSGMWATKDAMQIYSGSETSTSYINLSEFGITMSYGVSSGVSGQVLDDGEDMNIGVGEQYIYIKEINDDKGVYVYGDKFQYNDNDVLTTANSVKDLSDGSDYVTNQDLGTFEEEVISLVTDKANKSLSDITEDGKQVIKDNAGVVVNIGSAQFIESGKVFPSISVEDCKKIFANHQKAIYQVLDWTLYGTHNYLAVVSTDVVSGTYFIDVLVHNEYHIAYSWTESQTGYANHDIIKGGSGTTIKINGEAQNEVPFTSDPQTQLNNKVNSDIDGGWFGVQNSLVLSRTATNKDRIYFNSRDFTPKTPISTQTAGITTTHITLELNDTIARKTDIPTDYVIHEDVGTTQEGVPFYTKTESDERYKFYNHIIYLINGSYRCIISITNKSIDNLTLQNIKDFLQNKGFTSTNSGSPKYLATGGNRNDDYVTIFGISVVNNILNLGIITSGGASWTWFDDCNIENEIVYEVD